MKAVYRNLQRELAKLVRPKPVGPKDKPVRPLTDAQRTELRLPWLTTEKR